MDLTQIYTRRDTHVHKGQFGRLLVIAGSKKYTGSPIFNAMAALRSGCDLVTIATPERPALVAASYTPDIITYPLSGDYLSIDHVDEILPLIETDHITAVVMGGGLGRTDNVYDVIEALISQINLPIVIDAEAIRCVGRRSLKFTNRGQTILTPNRNEMLELASVKVLPEEHKIIELTTKISNQYNATILLKGPTDIVSDGKNILKNTTGSNYMTKGGFGDTLAGICGALLARKVGAFSAALAASYINGKAGELAAVEKGEGLLASDIFTIIPKVIQLP